MRRTRTVARKSFAIAAAIGIACLPTFGCQPSKDPQAYDEAIKAIKNENSNVAFCEKIAAVHKVAQKKQDQIGILTYEAVKKRQLASEELADSLRQIEKDASGVDPELLTALKCYTLAHDAFVTNVKNCDDFDFALEIGAAKTAFAYIAGGTDDAVGKLNDLPSPKTGAEAYKQANLAIIDMKIQANHFNDVAAAIEKRDAISLQRIDIVFRKGASEGLLLKPEMVNSWPPEQLEAIKKENTP
jgi:hypothetical protein